MELVLKVRQQFEAGNIDEKLLEKLYLNYHPLSEIKLFLTRAKRSFPLGNCGLASLYLQHLIGGVIIQGYYKKNKHTFLLKEKIIIDITADQFKGPKVYVGPIQEPWYIP